MAHTDHPEIALTADCSVVRDADDDFCEFRVLPIGRVHFQIACQPPRFAEELARFWAGEINYIELCHEPNATTMASRDEIGRYLISSLVESSGTSAPISEASLRVIFAYIATLPTD